MIKLLINDIDDIQKIIEIEITGNYFDASRILWDERIDGAISDEQLAQVGGFTLIDNEIVFSQDDFDANQALVNAEIINRKKDAVRSIRKMKFQFVDDLRDEEFWEGNLSSENKALVKTYRKALKDITDLVVDENTDIDAIEWPDEPSV